MRGFTFPKIRNPLDLKHLAHRKFELPAVFKRARFYDDAIFNGTVFKGDANFEEVVFEKGGGFENTIFEVNANFDRIFLKRGHDLDFTETYFEGDVSFEGARFKGRAFFQKCTFDKRAVFVYIISRDHLRFTESEFNGSAHFRHITKGSWRVISKYPNLRGAEVRFDRIYYRPEQDIIIEDCTCYDWSFALSYAVPEIKFFNINWVPPRSSRKRTKDETNAEENGSEDPSLYKKAAEVYRFLRLNYESRLAYEEASDFHIGQMEMLYKNPDTGWWKRRFLWLYRAVSNFGESVKRPLYWFLGLWGFFTLIWFSAPAIPSFENILRGELISPWGWVGFEFSLNWFKRCLSADWTGGFIYVWNSIWKTFGIFITGSYPDGGVFSKGFAAFQRLASASVITLFILALRRAFRR